MFLPLGFFAPQGPAPLPAIDNQAFGVDATIPLTDGDYFDSTDLGGTPITTYGSPLGSVKDRFAAAGAGWWNGANTPTIDANAANSKPGFGFSGSASGDVLYMFTGGQDGGNIAAIQGTMGGSGAECSVFVAFKLASVPAAGVKYRVCTFSTFADPPSVGSLELYVMSDGIYFERNGTVQEQCKLAITPNTSTVYKAVGRFFGFNPATPMQLNVNAFPVVNHNPTGAMESNSWDLVNLGAGGFNSNPGESMDGHILEARIYAKFPTDDQVAALIAYATDKWGA